jgi:hypothetical protein
MSDQFDMMIRALTDDQFDALIRTLQAIRQRQKDDVLIRQIVADNRRPAYQPPALTVRVEGAAPVVTGNDGPKHGGGWVEARRLDDWQHRPAP